MNFILHPAGMYGTVTVIYGHSHGGTTHAEKDRAMPKMVMPTPAATAVVSSSAHWTAGRGRHIRKDRTRKTAKDDERQHA